MTTIADANEYDERLVLPCSCIGECIYTVWEAFRFSDRPWETTIQFYEQPGNLGFWWKIGQIKKILTSRKIYWNSVSIRLDQAEQLRDWLTSSIEEDWLISSGEESKRVWPNG